MVIPYSIFNWKNISKTGGLSGSISIPDNTEQYHQFKFSIFGKRGFQKAKAKVKGGTDHENLQEVIVGSVAGKVAGELVGTLQSPEIDFVDMEDPKDKGINIASKYFNNFQNFGDVFRENYTLGNKEEVRYLKLDFNADNNSIAKRSDGISKVKCHAVLGAKNLPYNIQRGIADGVALNAFLGNADINAKGNFGIVNAQTNNKKELTGGQVAILDFGHGLGNLFSGPKAFGGGGDKGILDFLNRKKVVKPPRGGKSKLWRDYEGLVHSKNFVDALNDVADAKDAMKAGLANAKEKLTAFNEQLEDKSMLIKSLQRVNKNIGAGRVDIRGAERLIDLTMDNIEEYCDKRMSEMKKVAQTIDLQMQIDKHLKNSPDEDLPKDLTTKFNELQKDGKVSWVRDTDYKPKTTNLDEYVSTRKRALKARDQKSKKNKPAKYEDSGMKSLLEDVPKEVPDNLKGQVDQEDMDKAYRRLDRLAEAEGDLVTMEQSSYPGLKEAVAEWSKNPNKDTFEALDTASKNARSELFLHDSEHPEQLKLRVAAQAENRQKLAEGREKARQIIAARRSKGTQNKNNETEEILHSLNRGDAVGGDDELAGRSSPETKRKQKGQEAEPKAKKGFFSRWRRKKTPGQDKSEKQEGFWVKKEKQRKTEAKSTSKEVGKA